MTTYARKVDGRVVEIIEPFVNDEGREVPITERFHPDFVAQLIEYDPANPPPMLGVPALTVEQVRAQRDALLSASDWTQLRDVADDIAEAWAPYRQALRDVPEQAGFPAAIDWPETPA